jgi:hypothetical protein
MQVRATIRLAAALTVALALGACGASAQSTTTSGPRSQATSLGSAPRSAAPATSASASSSAGCGAQAPATLATAVGTVARRIYEGELGGSETRADQRQVETYAPLLNAVAAGSRPAIKAAVTSLVFAHTHIVRLRVTHGSSVLADVGGPYILAPAGGTLRLHGRAIGRYVLSVQDDLGYVKLVTRFLGVPLVMRAGSQPVPVQGLAAGPGRIPDLGPVSYRGRSYEAFSFDARSFPDGPLRVSLLVPLSGSLAGTSCPQIRASELGHAAQLISRRFSLSPASFTTYVKLVRMLTGGLVYVRSGARQLAGSTRPGPARLPRSGRLSYRGSSYLVSSFAAPSSVGPLRIYHLARA